MKQVVLPRFYSKRLRTKKQIRGILERLNAEEIYSEPGITGIIGSCKRPME